MNKNTRLDENQDLKSAIIKLADGNPGALNACLELATASPEIDPDAVMQEFAPLISLDMFGIYGSDIYILFSDICGKSVPKALAVLRATSLGEFPAETLADACSRQDYSGRAMVPVDDLCAKVKERLPNFNISVLDAEVVG